MGAHAIVVSRPLISEEYRAMQTELHKNPNYGVASLHYGPLVSLTAMQEHTTEVLDYGAGKGRLAGELRRFCGRQMKVRHYDPAIPEWSATPEPCDFVACIDVLEHIEPDMLDAVLDDLQRVTRKAGLFTIHTGRAVKTLPDGRNAHLIQQPAEWWLPKLKQRFDIVAQGADATGFWVYVRAKGATNG